MPGRDKLSRKRTQGSHRFSRERTQGRGCKPSITSYQEVLKAFKYSQEVPRQMTRLHLAAYFGLKEAVMALLENGPDLNSQDSHGWSSMP